MEILENKIVKMSNDSQVSQFLNFSKKNNCFAVLSARTGSRNLIRILELFDFETYSIEEDNLHFVQQKTTLSHSVDLIKNHQDYKMILSCRNPYETYTSWFRLKKINDGKIKSNFDLKKEFLEFLVEYLILQNEDPWKENPNNTFLQKLLGRHVDYRIKLETFEKSLLEVPFIANSTRYKLEKMHEYVQENLGDSKNPNILKHFKEYLPSDFRDYYNSESANIIYENFKSKFLIMDYDKDSWIL